MSITAFPKGMHDQLGHYVYMYLDPETDKPFYVGVGQGNRAFAHLRDLKRSPKTERIRTILASGRKPKIDVVVHGLADRTTALKVEAALINVLGMEQLTNAVRGWGSVIYGRREAEALRAHYSRDPVEVVHPSVLIKISRLFRPDMQPRELYDATRSAWKIGAQRNKVAFALAVCSGFAATAVAIRATLPDRRRPPVVWYDTCFSPPAFGLTVCPRLIPFAVRPGPPFRPCSCERTMERGRNNSPFPIRFRGIGRDRILSGLATAPPIARQTHSTRFGFDAGSVTEPRRQPKEHRWLQRRSGLLTKRNLGRVTGRQGALRRSFTTLTTNLGST